MKILIILSNSGFKLHEEYMSDIALFLIFVQLPLSSKQPAYLHSLLTPARQLRSSNSNLLFVPSIKTNVGGRAISVAALTVELTPC